jgi:hypothetical protein
MTSTTPSTLDDRARMEQRALPGAVRADDRQRLAALDVQSIWRSARTSAVSSSQHLAERVPDRGLPGEAQV